MRARFGEDCLHKFPPADVVNLQFIHAINNLIPLYFITKQLKQNKKIWLFLPNRIHLTAKILILATCEILQI